MQALRLVVPALALAIVLSSIYLSLGLATASRTSDSMPRPTPNDHEPLAGASTEISPSDEGRTLSASMPAEDVRGSPIPGLPRYPGSARVYYSEDRAGGLVVVRAGYLAEKPSGSVRDFYDDVFRSGRWSLANVEYSGGQWSFLAVRGAREAEVAVSSGDEGSMVEVELSRPVDQEEGSAGGSKR